MQNTDIKPKPNHFHKTYKDDRLPYEGGLKRLTGIAKFLRYGLILFVPLAAFQAAITAFALHDLAGWQTLLIQMSQNQSLGIYALSGLSIVYRLVYIYCIVLTCWFLFRAARNLHTVAPDQIVTKPHWAWLWFFIPIANFYKPYEAVSEIDQVTRKTIGEQQIRNADIMTWWVLFISSVFIGATHVTLPIQNLYLVLLTMDVASGVLAIAAAVFFIRITSSLAENQSRLNTKGIAQVFE